MTPAQRRQFFALLAAGLNPAQAARECGLSRQTGWRLSRGVEGSRSMVEMDRREEAMPDPKSWDALDGGVRDTLADFNAFAEAFMLRRPVPWRKDAAERVVQALQDHTSRSYLVLSQPPGSGKSTLFSHDIPVWLIAGGGLLDPLRGRAVRIMLGSFGYRSATHYVQRIQRLLESPRPFYGKATQRRAELSLVTAFGRFKPRQQGVSWAKDEFIVEQLDQVDLSEKEPTVQAASRESGFLGERVELAVWDDLVTTANVRSVEVRTDLARWFEDEAETRVEPGGARGLGPCVSGDASTSC